MDRNTKDILILLGIGCVILFLYNWSFWQSFIPLFLIFLLLITFFYIILSILSICIILLNSLLYKLINHINNTMRLKIIN